MYASSSHVASIPSYSPHLHPSPHIHPPHHSPHHQQLPQNHNQPQPQHNTRQNNSNVQPRETINVLGIPSLSIQNNQLVVGSASTTSQRSYTRLRMLGDGSFGTVWLCDWHGILPPNTPLSAMQSGNCRPEWVGKRLVAVKSMKKRWEGGWDEAKKMKELESLRAIPCHPNVIRLYDFFLLPESKELYFVFEPMEGNLFHLIKSRRGRALAGGLVSSVFRQIVAGLDHIHAAGYFHRDMKPENVLVTTTGYYEYASIVPGAPPDAPKEKDVVTIIKLADFGLARETKSKPPYTEYVSTRWYRAPEVLLLSRDYSNPVDMWALGTIMAELVMLRPLFPGDNQMDQLRRICQILGDPVVDYGTDGYRRVVGGGRWSRGVDMANSFGFQFPRSQPVDFHSLFEKNVPPSLILCIRELLRYDPSARLTSRQCLSHPYLLETTPRNNLPMPVAVTASSSSQQTTSSSSTLPASTTARQSNQPFIPDAASSHRSTFYEPSSHAHKQQAPQPQVKDYPMENTPQAYPQESNSGSAYQPHAGNEQATASTTHTSKLGLFSSFTFGKKRSDRRMFGGDKAHQLPPVDEIPMGNNMPSLKRTQSSDTDKSVRNLSPVNESPPRTKAELKKINKKEAERLQREAEKERRRLAAKLQREQARSVMAKRSQEVQKGNDIEWGGGSEQRLGFSDKGKQAASGPIRQNPSATTNAAASSTLSAAAGRYAGPSQVDPSSVMEYRERAAERVAKVRRREYDDDHSMSSSDVHSVSRMSAISFATVDSDPGPSRIRHRPSLFSIHRMPSMSSLRTSVEDFPTSARSSNSISLEGQLAHDFRIQASVATPHLAGSVSPPPMQMLSLSPTLSPPVSPPPPWIHVQHHNDALQSHRNNAPYGSFEIKGQLHPRSPRSYGHPPSPLGLPPRTGDIPESAINPIFKVRRTLNSGDDPPQQPGAGLPPFSQLEAVADGYSPMTFAPPPED